MGSASSGRRDRRAAQYSLEGQRCYITSRVEITHAHGIGEGAVHVAKKEVSELNGEEASEKQAILRSC